MVLLIAELGATGLVVVLDRIDLLDLLLDLVALVVALLVLLGTQVLLVALLDQDSLVLVALVTVRLWCCLTKFLCRRILRILLLLVGSYEAV